MNRPEKRPLKEVLLAAIRARPGVARPQLMQLSKKCRTVGKKALAVLRNEGKIECRGNKRAGGYHGMDTNRSEKTGE